MPAEIPITLADLQNFISVLREPFLGVIAAWIILRLIGVIDRALQRQQMPQAGPAPAPALPSPPAPAPKPGPLPPPPTPTPTPEPAPAPAPASKPIPAGEPTDHSFQAYRADYALRWAGMKIMPQHQAVIDRDVGKIAANKTRYEGVASSSGVPWYVIGILDMMEAGGGCSAHLHNGDPLSGRTIHVPSGRPPPPAEPPFTWEQSALDALNYDGLDRVKVWDAETVAWCFERFNGFGYRAKGVPTPYLWSFSDQYTSGKFVADHVFDPAAVSAQAGAMTLLRGLVNHDPSIKL